MNKLANPLWLLIAIAVLAGCSSLRKAELQSGDDPEAAVSEVTQIMTAAQQDQIDVLADKLFSKGRIYLADAERGLKQAHTAESILDSAAIAKAFFEDARAIAKPRRAFATRILEARASALAAGVRKSDALVDRLSEIDEDLKSETKQFSRSLGPDEFAELQRRYLVLETSAVQFTELNGAKQVIKKAIDHNADDLAPQSLRTAQLDYQTAMNMIAQSPRTSELYKESVNTALASATQLDDVMNVIMDAKGTPENIAVQIVKQKRALGELTTNVGKLKENLETTKKTLEQKEGVLKSQEEQLAKASTQVRFQQAMDEARKQIPPEDALVYQQGNKLVFRLKRINFPSGTARIPEPSKNLLAKANVIIEKLDAEKVVVQGHTDSVGSDAVNQKLSTERAKAVADYLYSLGSGYIIGYTGFGESYPLASNETAAGRATNRRVDLVVSVKQ